jgi:hypothetical protein
MSLSTVSVGEHWADDGDYDETLQQWKMMAGLWKDRRARLKPIHQPRYRRDCVGELIQIDGSEHWWFEGRGPQCTLLV